MTHIISLFQQIQQSILFYCPSLQHKKAGRNPKISDLELRSLYILSYIIGSSKSKQGKNTEGKEIFRQDLLDKEKEKAL